MYWVGMYLLGGYVSIGWVCIYWVGVYVLGGYVSIG